MNDIHGPTGSEIADRAERAVEEFQSVFGDQAIDLALILGSGLGGEELDLEDARTFDLDSLPSVPRPSVEGHSANWTVGLLEHQRCLVIGGRVHGYEGVPLQLATLPVRVARALGARRLIVTNSAGGIRDGFAPGTLVRISDHLNYLGDSPLVGPHDPRLGARFVDMTEPYDLIWGDAVIEACAVHGVSIDSGIYASCLGPQYETPAEVRSLRHLGADLVGMSTVPEVIVARQVGLRVFGLSVVTNHAAGLSGQSLDHEEVIEAGARARQALARVVSESARVME